MSIYETRLARVRQQMVKQGVELLVLTPSPYMYYVSGIQNHPYFSILKGPGDWLNSLWIGLEGDPVLVVHWMVYRLLESNPNGLIQIAADVRIIEDSDDPMSLLRELFGGYQVGHGAIALADRTWTQFSEALRALMNDNNEIRLASELMDGLIAIKDEEALRLLKRSCEITDAMYSAVIDTIRPGMTEREIILEVEYHFRKLGADGISFPASVVFAGPNIDPRETHRQLQPGDSIMFDVGCVYQGYCSDFGRSAFVGEPPAKYLELHETVLSAQRAGIQAMIAGVTTCEQIVPVVQNVLADKGYPPAISQVGHGIGMTIHEAPLLLTGDATIIQPGMTFTVEPTVRVPGWHSNRVEDIILVTEEGVDYLSKFPRDLHIVN